MAQARLTKQISESFYFHIHEVYIFFKEFEYFSKRVSIYGYFCFGKDKRLIF